MAMKGVETKDFNKGPWWLYESENNESCKAAEAVMLQAV